MNAAYATTLCLTASLAAGSAVVAQDAASVGKAFADHCFSPHLTAETAQSNLGPSGARIDFYDLRPFSANAPSPVTGRRLTAGTDRRCEVAFDGNHPAEATHWLKVGLEQEGLLRKNVELPNSVRPNPNARIIAAAQLNPNRIAIVYVGVREYNGAQETFIKVERLTQLDEAKP